MTPHYKENVTFQEMFLTSDGRLNCMCYFKRVLIFTAPAFLLYAMSIGSTYHGSDTGFGGAFGLFMLYCLIEFVPSMMPVVRRLQDLGQDSTFAWFFVAVNLLCIFGDVTGKFEDMLIFIIVVSIACFLLFLYIFFTPGTRERNRFGEEPLEGRR